MVFGFPCFCQTTKSISIPLDFANQCKNFYYFFITEPFNTFTHTCIRRWTIEHFTFTVKFITCIMILIEKMTLVY